MRTVRNRRLLINHGWSPLVEPSTCRGVMRCVVCRTDCVVMPAGRRGCVYLSAWLLGRVEPAADEAGTERKIEKWYGNRDRGIHTHAERGRWRGTVREKHLKQEGLPPTRKQRFGVHCLSCTGNELPLTCCAQWHTPGCVCLMPVSQQDDGPAQFAPKVAWPHSCLSWPC